jgi:hypothetical protein
VPIIAMKKKRYRPDFWSRIRRGDIHWLYSVPYNFGVLSFHFVSGIMNQDLH